jgi:hypothetical protein
MGDFVAWLHDLYERIEPLRSGERGTWQLSAYGLVDEFPIS